MRFFLDKDDDGHDYLIPEKHRQEWEAWCELDSDDEAAWDVPKWAIELGMSPNCLTFESPMIDGCPLREVEDLL